MYEENCELYDSCKDLENRLLKLSPAPLSEKSVLTEAKSKFMDLYKDDFTALYENYKCMLTHKIEAYRELRVGHFIIRK